MAYQHKNAKGNTYYLHSRVTLLRNGKEQRIFYFAKEVKEGAIDVVPAGYVVSETQNGLPVLRKKG